MRTTVFLMLLLFVGLSAQAQKKWTLRECIDYAVENNIDIRQQELTLESAEIDLNTSRNSRLPNLSVRNDHSVSFGQSEVSRIDELTGERTTVTKDRAAYSANISASSGVTVFNGFRINNQVKALGLDLKAATENLNKAKNDMELSVTSYYLEVLFRKEILKVYQEQVSLIRQQVEQTRALVESGKVPVSQLYDINAQLAKDELNVVNADNESSLSLLSLSQVLNLQDFHAFDIIEPKTVGDMVDGNDAVLSADEVYQTALGIKPHVREAEYRLQSSIRNVSIAKADFWPTLNFSVGYSNGFSHIINGDNFESIKTQLKNRGNEYLSLNLNIPIFNRFATRNKVRSAHIGVRSRELELEKVKQSIYKEIQQASHSALAAKAKYISTRQALEAAEKAFDYAKERYGVGKSTAYEFADAQTKLLSARSESVQAKYDYVFRNKILDFYRGETIDIN